MNTMKQNIIRILRSTEREGIDDLIEYLDEGTDFFTAPASTRHHCAYVGGLAEHSLNVRGVLIQLAETFGVRVPHDSMNIVALMHDVCKTGFYVLASAWRKDEFGKWESYTKWGVKDLLPLGHGEKSLYIINKFIQLSDAEAAAIRWHMGAWTEGVTSGYSMGKAYNTAVDNYPLVTLLATADNLSSHLIEKETTI